jgi:hypothetical protein
MTATGGASVHASAVLWTTDGVPRTVGPAIAFPFDLIRRTRGTDTGAVLVGDDHAHLEASSGTRSGRRANWPP